MFSHIHALQDISLDFSFTRDISNLVKSNEDIQYLEDAITEALVHSNIDRYTDIQDAEIIEGGFDSTSPVEDYFHIIITFDIDMDDDESEGIDIDTNKLIEALKNIDIIGQYIDTSTIDIEIHSIEDVERIEYEPDWDSMPGGHDYYDD